MVSDNALLDRLDKILASRHPEISRSALQSLIKTGEVSVDGQIINRPDKKVSFDAVIDVNQKELLAKAPKIELPVLYEDDDCVVINKSKGVLSHSKGAFNPEATVATWLSDYLANDGVSNRDGIVHRLDRDTSGVMICAKNEASLKWLQKQFSTRKVKKTYLALVEGEIDPEEAIIDMPIERNPKRPQTFRVGANGKHAETAYKTEQYIEMPKCLLSLVKLIPKTGRTHQLRVHLKHLKRPIVGDKLYGGLPADRLYLHALSLELTLPNKKQMTFSAGLPKEFDNPKLG
jgi:23S rRNA pseudouridine1911/1915/1917 synthase